MQIGETEKRFDEGGSEKTESATAAYARAAEGVKKLPLNGDMHYNYAVSCESRRQWLDAYEGYRRAYFIYSYCGDEKADTLALLQRADAVLAAFERDYALLNSADKEKAAEELRALNEAQKNEFSLAESAFRASSFPQIVGGYYYINRFSRRYAGVFKDQYLSQVDGSKDMDVMHLKAEFLEADEGTFLRIGGEAEEYLVPVASDQALNVHTFTHMEDRYSVCQVHPHRFSWYRVSGGTVVRSQKKSYYGKPVPLKYDARKKRLVLSIFVDGLSASILQSDRFAENMPYTYTYFKKGTIFTHAYNTSEWTYPSIATYVTGLHTWQHMLLHPEIDWYMPEDVPTLPEYFQNDGYYTSKYCGNWRIIPSYGHARGYDRFVYQNQSAGFKVHEVIGDAINQMEAFDGINQYMWISIGDLHDIADLHDLPTAVQKDMTLSERTYIAGRETTSVKMGYNENDRTTYLKMAKYIDRWLHILYNYLEENYHDDEIVVSLFSDHGQGYLIDRKDAHFLSTERSNVPMFFRGGCAEGIGICEELVSAVDYSRIMRKLADIPSTGAEEYGHLPLCFGGEMRREYALTESIFPGDPYYAAIFTESGSPNFFFINPEPTQNDGRIVLGEYTCWLEDEAGKRLPPDGREEKYMAIMMKHIAPMRISL